MTSISEFVRLTPKQRAAVFKSVFAQTTTGTYGDIVYSSNSLDEVLEQYNCCKTKYKLVASGDGQFSGGFSQDVFQADENTFYLFDFQNADLYYYEKRIKTYTDFPDEL